MIVEGYGKTLSRPGLGIVERELATVAALAEAVGRRCRAARGARA